MKVFESFDSFSLDASTAIALGNFDGVHLGHQAILRRLMVEAETRCFTPVVFSFQPHPRRFFQPDNERFKLLLSADEKIELFAKLGLEHCLLQRFDEAFSKIPADKFVSDVLLGKMKSKLVLLGRDFKFGFQAKGSIDTLRSAKGLEVIEAEDVIAGQQSVSSSRIREAVIRGDVEEANECLGYPFFMTGVVEKGQGRGESLNTPTINLSIDRECAPQTGVYQSMVEDLETGSFFCSISNFGTRPTFDGESLSFESYLLQFSDDLYGRAMRVYLLDRVRDEIEFSSAEELQAQIRKDIDAVTKSFQSMKLLQEPSASMKFSLRQPDAMAQSFQAIQFTK